MLEYVALGLLIFVSITLFYGIIAIHDIPYEIAKHRNHPQQDALHVAGWVSLFTLHILWPFLWIWATLYKEDRGWGFHKAGEKDTSSHSNEAVVKQLSELQARLEILDKKVDSTLLNKVSTNQSQTQSKAVKKEPIENSVHQAVEGDD